MSNETPSPSPATWWMTPSCGSSGVAVARFRIASTPRYRDSATGEWKDGDTLFLTCQVWRQAAENVAETLQKGMRAIVTGRLRQRSYETSEGEKRTVYELQVDESGPSLRNATAKVTKATRTSNGQGGGEGEASGSYSDEPPF
jgi:single-strand DNA-binding protein